jgi:predicted PurR-regulated permease PerM
MTKQIISIIGLAILFGFTIFIAVHGSEALGMFIAIVLLVLLLVVIATFESKKKKGM